MTTIKLWDNLPANDEIAPVLEYYPAENKTSDATVVIFPGGGYGGRADHEGGGYAVYFNSIGMDAFVCEYRVSPNYFPIPLLDARRSIRYVRANAEKYGVDPEKIAVMGSSAGGHLAAFASTYFEPIDGEGVDELDKICPIPNATVLCYPVVHHPEDNEIGHYISYMNLLGEDGYADCKKYSPDLIVSDKTPTAFIWHTSNDQIVDVTNSYLYASALKRQGIQHELHVFPDGPHGLGLSDWKPYVAQWVPLFKNWLISLGWLK